MGQCSNTADSATSKISTEVTQEIVLNLVNLHCVVVTGIGEREGERMTFIVKLLASKDLVSDLTDVCERVGRFFIMGPRL